MTDARSTFAPVRLLDAFARRFAVWVEPAVSGLPNWRVVWWFPAIVFLGFAVLVAFQLSGTSSGMHWGALGSGEDPRLLFGSPRAVRSDEWLVQQSWVVAQSNSGYGDTNFLFPGGSDMTVLAEIPSWHWSSLFRPHLWGYLLFGLDVGIAWFWWVPALILTVGCYLLVVTVLPRRPITAALIAVAIYFTPMLQWFYSPSVVTPAGWALLTMAGVVWILRDPRRWLRVVWAVVIGYLAVTTAMGMYVPFILPSLSVVLVFCFGYLARRWPADRPGRLSLLKRLVPLGIAALGAVAVILAWVVARWTTFEAFSSTVYPGQRVVETGGLLGRDRILGGLAGAPWDGVLRYTGNTILGGNSSEASSVILLAVFLIPALGWLVVDQWRTSRSRHWIAILLLGLLVVVGAYLFVPGWDAVAHLLQLDRIPQERMKYIFLVLGPVVSVLVVERLDAHPDRPAPRWVAIACTATAGVILFGVFLGILIAEPGLLLQATLWPVVVVAVLAAIVLMFRRRLVPVAFTLLLVASVVLGAGVNPVYRGIYDLSETETGKVVAQIDEEHSGTWLGVGSYEVMALLTQVDVRSYSGVQNYPSEEMWAQIDPDGRFEENWNRLAHIHWHVGSGPVSMHNTTPDVVEVTFDPCSPFGQERVDYVLADTDLDGTKCLQRLDSIDQGARELRVYDVVPAQ